MKKSCCISKPKNLTGLIANGKNRKKKGLLITLFFLIVCIIWLFGTGKPASPKVYSQDRQYSYYTAEYNFNKVPFIAFWYGDWGFGACTPCTYKRKVFLYDEVKKKVIKSGYGGNGWIVLEKPEPGIFSTTTFTYYYNYSDKCHKWKLPR